MTEDANNLACDGGVNVACDGVDSVACDGQMIQPSPYIIDTFGELFKFPFSDLFRNFNYRDGVEGVDLLCDRSLRVQTLIGDTGEPGPHNYVVINLDGIEHKVESQWFYGVIWALCIFFPDGLTGTTEEVLEKLKAALTPPVDDLEPEPEPAA